LKALLLLISGIVPRYTVTCVTAVKLSRGLYREIALRLLLASM